MDIDLLVRNSIKKISDKWGLPKKGFITGGSISNLVWEEVSGNKAIVNDVDVFTLEYIDSKYELNKSKYLYSFKGDEKIFYESYNGAIDYNTKTKNYYSILESTHDGIFNYVSYKSNTDDPMVVLDSFDINAVCVGYSIDLDKVFYTKEFEEFIKTGELKVTALRTPSHTAIRIVKKSVELNANLDNFEIQLIQHSIISNMLSYKVRFKDRYFELFKKYMDKLSEYFYIEKDLECMKSLNLSESLWFLVANKQRVFNDINLNLITDSDTYLFYMRNIYNNESLIKVWGKLHHLFYSVDYIDTTPTEKELEILSNIINVVPGIINNIIGMRLSEQLKLISNLFNAFDDKHIALRILERNKLDVNTVFDEETKLLLELSVRKHLTDKFSIAKRVFEPKNYVSPGISISCCD
jgi:hypothetical protein